MADVIHRVQEARFAYEQRVGAAREVAREGARVQAEVSRLEEAAEVHAKAGAMLTSIGERWQSDAQAQLEQMVTRGLQVVFGEELSFHAVQSVRANQTVVDFVIRSEYMASDGSKHQVDTPVLDARGGGMSAVTGFILRLVVLLRTPGARRILILDEAFAHVSPEFEQRVAEFCREVADQAGVQIILVSHSDAYDGFADKRYRLVPDKDGTAEVRELTR